jgi:hypothetical protein
MISGIGSSGNDLGINLLNNLLKDITNTQMDLTEKLINVDVTEQVQASQMGLGGNIDELA